MLSCLSHVQLFATICTEAHQAPLSMGFSSQESWSGLPCLSPRDLWDPGIESEPLGGKKKNIYIYIHTQPERRKWLSTLVFLLGNPMDRGNCWLQRTGGLQSMGLQKVRHDWPSSSSLLLCIKWITSECLLDSLGNSALWADLNGREIRQWGASVYVHLSHCAVRQELTQSCGATVLQQ